MKVINALSIQFHKNIIMKTQSFLLSLFSLLFISFSAIAQTAKTDNIKVWGNCGMCKKTIETAAKDAGATEANWNMETKVLAVSYTSSSNNQKIQKAVAASGYDTQDFTAPDEAYNKLHECCKYDRKAATSAKPGVTATGSSCCDGKDCCKDGKCEMGKDCCKAGGDCCKDGKCVKHAQGGKAMDCCKDGKCEKHAKGDKAMDCCKDGKCEKHAKGDKASADCCKDMKACANNGCCKS
jgi:hypothetical protein